MYDCSVHGSVGDDTKTRLDLKFLIWVLILTNEEGMIDEIHQEAPLGNSDHQTLPFKSTLTPSRTAKNHSYFKYNQGNYAEIRLDWKDMTGTK